MTMEFGLIGVMTWLLCPLTEHKYIPPPPAQPQRLLSAESQHQLLENVLCRWSDVSLDDVSKQTFTYGVFRYDSVFQVEERGTARLEVFDRSHQRMHFFETSVEGKTSHDPSWKLKSMESWGIVSDGKEVIQYWGKTKEYEVHSLIDEKLPVARPFLEADDMPEDYLPGSLIRNCSWAFAITQLRLPTLLVTLSMGTDELLEHFEWKLGEQASPSHFRLEGLPVTDCAKLSIKRLDVIVDRQLYIPTAFRITSSNGKQTVYIVTSAENEQSTIKCFVDDWKRPNLKGWKRRN